MFNVNISKYSSVVSCGWSLKKEPYGNECPGWPPRSLTLLRFWWQRGKTAGLAARSSRGVSTRSPSSFLILTHMSPGIPQQAHRGLSSGPGPRVVQCYRAHQKMVQRMSQCYPLEIPISEETINVITRLVLCSQSDDIYWQHFMGAKQRLFHKSHLPDCLPFTVCFTIHSRPP